MLGIVYRCIATQLVQMAGFFRKTAQVGAVTLIQRFVSAPTQSLPGTMFRCPPSCRRGRINARKLERL